MTASLTRRPRSVEVAILVTSCLILSIVSCACNESSAESLREWTPADHDHQSKPGSGQVDTEARKAAMPDLTKHGIDDVVLAAWKQNCVQCHGVIGRGDGPQGRALSPPDFTNPAWQRVRVDSEMANAIKKGRGNMPPFGHLPDSTVSGLVQLVRMLNPDRAKEDDSAPKTPEGEEPNESDAPEADKPAEGTSAPKTEGE